MTPVRVVHVGYVLVFLLVIVVLGLGAYEALAAFVDPNASAVLPVFQSLTRSGAPSPVASPVP
jgi:hypothetical protein